MRAIAKEGFSGRDRLTLVDLPIPNRDQTTSSCGSGPPGEARGTRRLGKDASARAAGQEVLGARCLFRKSCASTFRSGQGVKWGHG
jgi:hypothetical protein